MEETPNSHNTPEMTILTLMILTERIILTLMILTERIILTLIILPK